MEIDMPQPLRRRCLPVHRDDGSRRSMSGVTMVELTVGIVILATLMTVLIRHLLTTYNSTREHKDRVYAYSKAQAILAEVQNYIDSAGIAKVVNLDDLNDNGKKVPTMTIKTSGGALVAPGHPLSENLQRMGAWVWSRSIEVQAFAGIDNKDLRYVTVKIYKKDRGGQDRLMADVSTVVNATSGVYPTTQVYDVYFFDIESIPGWWVDMESIRPFTEGLLEELQSRNPGMEVRSHWISKASYGRDFLYQPYLNTVLDSKSNIPYAYFYPGKMPDGNSKRFDYAPHRFKARMLFDGTTVNGYDATVNPLPYATVDYFNHAMRYPMEKAFHEKRIAAIQQRRLEIENAKAKSLPPPPEFVDMSEEPTLRLFLEDLYTNPAKYRNAIILNLHGELMPVPAVRNYSDAAKAPDVLPEVRVVTHPEELRTHKEKDNSAADHVRLRVHAYVTDPDTYTGPKTMPWSAGNVHPIMLKVMGVDLTRPGFPSQLHPDVTLSCLQGGVQLAGVAGSEIYQPLASARNYNVSPPTTAQEKAAMFYTVNFYNGSGENKYTLFYLYNTPVVSPAVNNLGKLQGLAATKRARLYGMEYVPGPVESALNFSHDLAADGAGPKNTARWVLDIGPGVLKDKRFVNEAGTYYAPLTDYTLTVQTRIYNNPTGGGSPLYTGVAFPTPNQPENFSETYTWWASSRDAVPITEQSQFQGDPRHVPYKDLMSGDPDFGDGYNWYYDDLQNGSEDALPDYPGIDGTKLADAWNGNVRQDLPRLYEILRTGIIGGHAMLSNLTGYSYFYMGVGNEVEAEVDQRPYGAPGKTAIIKQVYQGKRYFMRGQGADGTYWLGMPWLGEIYPDSVHTTQWMAKGSDGMPLGNLLAGDAAGQFYQAEQMLAYAKSGNLAYGTVMKNGKQQASEMGCVAFFNADNGGGATFNHAYSSGSGSLLPAGVAIGARYGIDLPTTADISRPFRLDYTGTMPTNWPYQPYLGTRGTVRVLQEYYDHPKIRYGAGLLELTDKVGTDSGFLVINGFSRSTVWGTDMIAKFAVLSMLHSYFEVGMSGLPSRALMPPRLEIESPTIVSELVDPTSISIKYDIEWKRWDGQPYLASASSTFAEDESQIYYVIYYSTDMGRSWHYIQDDSVALIATQPTNPAHVVTDWNPGAPETYTWSTPAAKFPKGSYLLRVEAYRSGQSLHYSHHMTQCYIDR